MYGLQGVEGGEREGEEKRIVVILEELGRKYNE